MKLITKAFIAALFVFATQASAEVAVIVNASNAAQLTDKDIARVFLGKEKNFANGQSVNVVYGKSGSASRGEFEQKVLHKSSSQIKAYWSKLIFTGKGTPPKELGSEQEVLSFVASTPNAIGYLDAASLNDSVRVVKKF